MAESDLSEYMDPDTSPDVMETVIDVMTRRFGVSGIKIKGAQRTSAAFLDRVLSPVISTGGNFQGVVEDIAIAVERLERTGVFHGVDAYLDKTSDSTADVVFTVNEKPFYYVQGGTSIRPNVSHETSAEAAVFWRNVSGKTDTLRASMSAGAAGRDVGAMFGSGNPSAAIKDSDRSVSIEYRAPYFVGLTNLFSARIEQYSRSWIESHFRERTREALLGVENDSCGKFDAFTAWRELHDVAENASVLVRDQAGHTIKHAIRHRWDIDMRDDPQCPSQGWKVGSMTEFAGLGSLGDAHFRKCELNAQYHLPLGASNISLSTTARLGAMSGNKVGILDRFFIGGPNCMRGFKHRGVGPRESSTSSALGGQAYYMLGAFASIAAPEHSVLRQLFRARLHAFTMVGDIGDPSRAAMRDITSQAKRGPAGWRSIGENIRDNARISAGVGIALATSFGRVEINWCHVIANAQADLTNSGVQIGLSHEFL